MTSKMIKISHRNSVPLPPPGTNHWGSRKKASVVLAIRSGLICREDACRDYLLSLEELAAWEAAFDRGGHRALTNKVAVPRANREKPPNGSDLVASVPHLS